MTMTNPHLAPPMPIGGVLVLVVHIHRGGAVGYNITTASCGTAAHYYVWPVIGEMLNCFVWKAALYVSLGAALSGYYDG